MKQNNDESPTIPTPRGCTITGDCPTPCPFQYLGALAVVHGGIFFILVSLPACFYCVGLGAAKSLMTKTTIWESDYHHAICLPCCNFCLIVFLSIGILGYIVVAVFHAISMFYCTETFTTAMGVFVSVILPFNIVACTGSIVVLSAMLPDSCRVGCYFCCKFQ